MATIDELLRARGQRLVLPAKPQPASTTRRIPTGREVRALSPVAVSTLAGIARAYGCRIVVGARPAAECAISVRVIGGDRVEDCLDRIELEIAVLELARAL